MAPGVTALTDRQQLVRALARTYGGPELDRDGWERVEEYERVIEYAADNPDAGSTAISTALDVPRARIRPWLDNGARPDPVRGIDTATDRGWLDLEPGTTTRQAIVSLVAWIFAGGAIQSDIYRPYFAVEPETRDSCERALSAVGLEYTVNRPDEEGRATELAPSDDTTVFGRLLAALGAPVGAKHERMSLTLPEWLPTSDWDTQFVFARTYLLNRGVERPDQDRHSMQITEKRSAEYRSELVSFFQELVGEEHIRDGPTIGFSPTAATVLCRPPLSSAESVALE